MSDAQPSTPSTPWSDLEASGSGLDIEHFLTFLLSRLGNEAQRLVTSRYLEPFALSVSEWRTLSGLAKHSPTPFSQLVAVSSADKALVSRSLQELARRGLAKVDPDPDNGKRKVCRITPAGRRLYRRVMPGAQRRQAEILLHLDRAERDQLYLLLEKLRPAIGAIPLPAGDAPKTAGAPSAPAPAQ
ncbi:MAG: MarR family winged helix-turn-helix transcriptional regulator [Pigmentiphaga sp.]|nr:MarR family winged helix-turn-helix transcriptional regulator [Pigmentiphaga sp.]